MLLNTFFKIHFTFSYSKQGHKILFVILDTTEYLRELKFFGITLKSKCSGTKMSFNPQ